MRTRLVTIALACAALCLFGCGPGKLNENKNWELDVGDGKALDLPAVSKPQKVNVEFSSTDSEIWVGLFKEEDAKGEDGILTGLKSKALESKKGKEGSFSFDVPENTATRVVVRDADKKTTVKLKVTN